MILLYVGPNQKDWRIFKNYLTRIKTSVGNQPPAFLFINDTYGDQETAFLVIFPIIFLTPVTAVKDSTNALKRARFGAEVTIKGHLKFLKHIFRYYKLYNAKVKFV